MLFKCKMCGGDIQAHAEATHGSCDSCGTTSTLPRANEERIVNLFNRANHFRRQNEFDKAMATYENILEEDPKNAEAHWGVVLCRYGIEYVEDPKTGKRIPTCHRVQHAAFLTDLDYLAAIENTTEGYTLSLYKEEANTIAEIQKGILAIAADEDPYDVFICYKETAEGGGRTIDSTLAQDIYYHFEKEGLKVFFARITLEDKLGRDYEPYIFNALNTAKVMLVIGTKKEYFEATWVKNEWSRFLSLMKDDRSRLLIPCYRDMDGYDIPDELSNLQAQDMGKIGFIQDLLRGIKKVLRKDEPKPAAAQPVAAGAAASVDTLLKRAWIFLEDGEQRQAGEYFDRVLDIDPECAPAYIGKFCAGYKFTSEEQLASFPTPLTDNGFFQRALTFADPAYKTKLEGYAQNAQKLRELNSAIAHGENREGLTEAVRILENLGDFKNANEWLEHCRKQQQIVYDEGLAFTGQKRYSDAIACFAALGEYRDAQEQITHAQGQITQINKALEARERRKRRRRTIAFLTAIVAGIVIFLTYTFVNRQIYNAQQRARNYSSANRLLSRGQYSEAIALFRELGNYGTSRRRYRDAMNELYVIRERIAPFAGTIAAGSEHTAGLRTDGTVVCSNGWIHEWTDIVAITAGSMRITTGLIADGTVTNPWLADQDDWTDLVAIALRSDLHEHHLVGLRADGTVVDSMGWLVGDEWPVDPNEWTGIIAISAGNRHIVGLRANGTVVAVGNNQSGQLDVSDWTDIVAISAGGHFTVGLRADGTVVAAGSNNYGQLSVPGWRDIVAISAGIFHTVGLRADGTVVATGINNYGQLGISGWTDIVAIAADWRHTVGLKRDGTVVVVGSNERGQLNVTDWQNIGPPQ